MSLLEIYGAKKTEFEVYEKLLLEWNQKINLTAITEHKDIETKHFLDSLTPLEYRDFKNKYVIDVGTGAGFPGLPLKIAVPEIRLCLMDSLNKRINFLNEVTDALKLENVDCVHSRAEDGARDKKYREKFDIAISRAVAALNVLAEYDLPFVKAGGEMIALKGPSAFDEIKQAEKAIKTLGGEISDVKETELSGTDLKHTIVFIKKIKATPAVNPRKATKISKNPIL